MSDIRPMSQEQAQAEAERRWKGPAFAEKEWGVCEVGMLFGPGARLPLGYGATFEEAFVKAEARLTRKEAP